MWTVIGEEFWDVSSNQGMRKLNGLDLTKVLSSGGFQRATSIRITSNLRSCIHHILVRCSVSFNMESVSWMVDAGVTDHRMMVICLKIKKIVKTVNK